MIIWLCVLWGVGGAYSPTSKLQSLGFQKYKRVKNCWLQVWTTRCKDAWSILLCQCFKPVIALMTSSLMDRVVLFTLFHQYCCPIELNIQLTSSPSAEVAENKLLSLGNCQEHFFSLLPFFIVRIKLFFPRCPPAPVHVVLFVTNNSQKKTTTRGFQLNYYCIITLNGLFPQQAFQFIAHKQKDDKNKYLDPPPPHTPKKFFVHFNLLQRNQQKKSDE